MRTQTDPFQSTVMIFWNAAGHKRCFKMVIRQQWALTYLCELQNFTKTLPSQGSLKWIISSTEQWGFFIFRLSRFLPVFWCQRAWNCWKTEGLHFLMIKSRVSNFHILIIGNCSNHVSSWDNSWWSRQKSERGHIERTVARFQRELTTSSPYLQNLQIILEFDLFLNECALKCVG